MTGGIVDFDVTGGRCHDGDSYENTVTIDGTATVGNAVDDDGEVFGGYSKGGHAWDNAVYIRGGTVNGEVTGGMTYDPAVGDAENNEVYMTGGTVTVGLTGGYSRAGTAANNFVEVTGGTITEGVVGGYSEDGDAVNNTVRIGSGVTLGTSAILFGGIAEMGGDALTGNTLYVDGFRGTLDEIQNFAHYNFQLPDSLANGQTLITITGAATDLTGASVDTITLGAGSTLEDSHTVTLLSSVTGSFTDTTIQAAKGTSLIMDTLVKIDSGALTATFGASSLRANPQGKALSQSRIGGMTLLGGGADLVADTIFDSALGGASLTGGGSGPAIFGSTSMSRFRTKTGSHVDTDGVSLLAGLAWKGSGPDCSGWLGGVFFETGHGSYDGYNSFTTAGSVHSKGDLDYYGGGVMGQYRLMNGFRAEGSFRLGRLDTDYRANGYAGGIPRYDLNALYLGAHAGIGYSRDLTEKLSLDVSAKYLWTRQTAKSVDILAESHRFDAIDSHRARVGGRVAYNGCILSPFAGAYFEYEFGGTAKATNKASGIRYDSPKIRGATYIGEAGVRLTPVRNLDIDLSVQGHGGRRDGVTGRLAAGWTF